MKRLFLFGLAIAGCLSGFAQNDSIVREDPVVMNVAGNDITRSEFEYFFYKNNTDSVIDDKTVRKYADLYANFKLKVAAAMNEKMDTTQSFLSEFKQYRDIAAEKYLVSQKRKDNLALAIFNESRNEIGEKGLYFVGVITLRPENTPEALAAAKNQLDSIRNCIVNGEDFRSLATRYSNDDFAEDGGLMGWVSRNQLPDEFAAAVYDLELGELSEPHFSYYGWQLYKIFGQRKFDNFEEHRESIMEWIDERGLVQDLKLEQAREFAEQRGWDVTPEVALAREDSMLTEMYPDFKLLANEYHDGLLMFEISNREVWEKATSDTAALEAWFARNRRAFAYEEPHFKGLLIFAKNEQGLENVKALLEGVPFEEQVDKVIAFNRDSVQVRVMKGPFVKGTNNYCDRIVFNEGECKPMPGYPVTGYVGEVMNAPKTWLDASGKVVEHYENYLETEWVKKLRKHYKVRIDKKVLKTVGHHD